MSGKDLKRRIEQASGEVAVGAALKRALDNLNAAIFTAVIVPTVVAGGGSS
jgi:branched-subunit amino acid transport protein